MDELKQLMGGVSNVHNMGHLGNCFGREMTGVLVQLLKTLGMLMMRRRQLARHPGHLLQDAGSFPDPRCSRRAIKNRTS